jgi:hypothetical protein
MGVVPSYGVMSLLGSIPLGALGWISTNFAARPILRAYELRERVWEELLITANVSIFDEGRYEQSVGNLRRFAAQASALDVIWPRPLRWVLRHLGLDLREASVGLLGLSNTLGVIGHEPLGYRRRVQAALRLPTEIWRNGTSP